MKSKKTEKADSIIRTFSEQKASRDFEDELFPPNFESLFSSKKEIVNYETPIIPKFLKDKKKLLLSQFALSQKDGRYSWAKLPEVRDTSKLNVLRDSKNLKDDVIQGELGDCYFLSTLYTLAENPQNIKNMVTNSKVNDGAYEANVYIHGEPVKIAVDDYFPVANTSKIAFAGINENSGNIWPMILEKAWAKCNRSYEDIIPGNSADAIEFLTPAPYDTYYHTQEIGATLFKTIQDASKENYIILADITETKNTNLDELSKLGLITNHAYSVIDTAVLKKPNGNEIQLLKMKNIWGTNEWIGDWSDQSLKWTQEFKKAVGLQNKEDGVFWMSYDDYLQFYTTTHIAQVHSDYFYNVQKMKNKEPYNICKINIDRTGSGYFMVNLKNTRIYNNLKNPEYSNPFCSIIVMKKDDERVVYIGSDSGKKDRFYISCPEMEKGTYYVSVSFPKINKNEPLQNSFEFNQTEFNFRVGVYSTHKDAKLQEIEDKNELGDFIFDTISDNAEKNEEKYYFAQEGEPNSWRAIDFNNDRKGFGYIFYKNNSDAYIKERMEISSLQNINIIPILNEGYFMCKKGEEIKEEETPKPKSKQSTYKGKSKKKTYNDDDEDIDDKVNEKIDYESKNVSITINALKGLPLESFSEVIENGNPIIVQFNIAPHSSCAVLLQKTKDESDIDFSSDLCLDYLPNVLLGEQKFNQKKYRLRYNNKPVEVYECITEYNTGVFFQYKNRSSDFRVKITAKFAKYDNLFLMITSSDLERGEEMRLRKYAPHQFRDDNNDNFVELIIEPGETGFFGLNAIDVFEKFSYSCQFDYHFSLSKISSNLMNFEEGNVNKEEVRDI